MPADGRDGDSDGFSTEGAGQHNELWVTLLLGRCQQARGSGPLIPLLGPHEEVIGEAQIELTLPLVEARCQLIHMDARTVGVAPGRELWPGHD